MTRGYIHALKDTPDFKLDRYVQAAPDNYTVGRNVNGYRTGPQFQPDRIVIHVADGGYEGTLEWFSKSASPASAHFTVATDGRVGGSVREWDTAWHSGDWMMNVRSFGIEHEGRPSRGYWAPSEEQLRASARLTAYLCYKYGIPVTRQNIIGHNEVNPNRVGRKNCPGPTWPWEKFMRMVKEEHAVLALVYPKPTEPAPGHVKDGQENRGVQIVNTDSGVVVGTGTLVAGTDKVYIRSIKRELARPIQPKTSLQHRRVRLFDPETNKQVGVGSYARESGKVYFVSWETDS